MAFFHYSRFFFDKFWIISTSPFPVMKCNCYILSKWFYIFKLFYIKFPSYIWISQWYCQINCLLFLDQSAMKKGCYQGRLDRGCQVWMTYLSAESSVSDPGGSLVSIGSGFTGPGRRPGFRPGRRLVPCLDGRPTWPGVPWFPSDWIGDSVCRAKSKKVVNYDS